MNPTIPTSGSEGRRPQSRRLPRHATIALIKQFARSCRVARRLPIELGMYVIN